MKKEERIEEHEKHEARNEPDVHKGTSPRATTATATATQMLGEAHLCRIRLVGILEEREHLIHRPRPRELDVPDAVSIRKQHLHLGKACVSTKPQPHCHQKDWQRFPDEIETLT